MNKEILTIPQVAKICSLSRVTIWKYVRSGDLKASKTPGGQYRIHKTDFETFIYKKKMYPLSKYKPKKEKILIVDDDPKILKLLTSMLSRNGIHTEIASDGFEAGIKVMSFRPELIILDLFMPGIDGFEICRWIKANRNTCHIKILVITGYDTDENRQRILREGADYFLPKPLDSETILFTIDLLLNERGMNHDQKMEVA